MFFIAHVVNCTLYIQTEINDIKYIGKDIDKDID
jgi:hypothetical protein